MEKKEVEREREREKAKSDKNEEEEGRKIPHAQYRIDFHRNSIRNAIDRICAHTSNNNDKRPLIQPNGQWASIAVNKSNSNRKR